MAHHEMTGPLEPGTAALFGARLQRLVDNVYPNHSRPYTDTEIAEHVGVTSKYISKLRAGHSMPSLEKGRAIAALFDVDVDYLLKPHDHPAVARVEGSLPATRGSAELPQGSVGQPTEDELWLQLQQVHGVKEIALRAGQLSPGARASVLDIVNRILGSESEASGSSADAQPLE
ncbi:helix-turn-helix domain-containing protein [Streptomyces abikoensis]|uniref:helix-turn-helix domain-containing protein n=1 Tax=Streptomyces abikoensis TaxID=97398 RepID=UPI0033C771BE